MALEDHAASTGLSFGLEVNGTLVTRLTEVAGLPADEDVIEVKQNSPGDPSLARSR